MCLICSWNIRSVSKVCKDVEEFSIGICQLKLLLITTQDKYKSYNSGETKYNTNSTQSLLLSGFKYRGDKTKRKNIILNKTF